MRKIRRTIVSVEIEQVLLAKISGPPRLHCLACGEPVSMLTPEQSGVLAGLGLRAIFRLIEAGELHATESPTGTPLVCANSLASYCLKPQPGS
jgi:hypothetical protein